MIKKILIYDYSVGNIGKISNIFRSLDCNVILSKSKIDIKSCDALVMPGVGSFGTAMKTINESSYEEINNHKNLGKPILGICLGMHILFSESEEALGINGLNFFKGKIKHLSHLNEKNRKIPNINYKNLNLENKRKNKFSLTENDFFYFIHSFFLDKSKTNIDIISTNYGKSTIPSIIEKDNIVGLQFHPELSAYSGIKLLNNWKKYFEKV